MIASRASWGARFADGDLTLSGLATQVFAHHSVTAQLDPGATIAAEQAQMRHIEHIGQQRFGRGISYNVIIFPSGRAYQGVSWNRRGTHTGGLNSTSRSIAFAGNFEIHHPTAAALATAGTILAQGRGRWWTVGAPLRGHRAVSATACPGRHVQSRLGDIVAGGGGGGAGGGGFLDALSPVQQAQMFTWAANVAGWIYAGGPDVNAGAAAYGSIGWRAVHADRVLAGAQGAPGSLLERVRNIDQQVTGADGFVPSVAHRVAELEQALTAGGGS